jgi:hypothetical protein
MAAMKLSLMLSALGAEHVVHPHRAAVVVGHHVAPDAVVLDALEVGRLVLVEHAGAHHLQAGLAVGAVFR